MAAAGVGFLLTVLLAAPAQAQVPHGTCYPPPCAAPGPVAVERPGTAGRVSSAATSDPQRGTSPAPFAAAGLLMVAASFTAIACSRRMLLVRRARLAFAQAAAVAQAAGREPDRSYR